MTRTIRNDAGGDGHYGAPRSKKLSNGRVYRDKHNGTDYVYEPGEDVRAPATGFVRREAKPYAYENYGGVELICDKFTLVGFYFKLDRSLIGQTVQKGQGIGTAQDISNKYPGVTPHVHWRVTQCDPELLIDVK